LLSNAEQSLEKMMAEAVYWLQRAVKLDNQLPRGDMASVSNHYSSGLAILSSIVDHLPDSVRPDIEQKVSFLLALFFFSVDLSLTLLFLFVKKKKKKKKD
jgi:hypothetical protein